MGGRGAPGRSLARRGIDPRQVRLPKGLVGRVWREVARPYRGQLLLLLAVITVSAVLTVLPARLIKPIVDALSDGGPDAGTIVTRTSLLLLGVAVAAAGASLGQRWLSALVAERLILDLRRRLYGHVLRLPLAFFVRARTGALLSRLSTDVVGAQRALTGTFGALTANLVQVGVALVAMAAIDWRLTLASMAALPVLVIAARRLGGRLQSLTREGMQRNADMSTLMTERLNVGGASVVKLFGRVDDEEEAFGDRASAVADVGVRTAVVGRLLFALLGFIGAAGTALVYLVGGRLALTGELSPGDVVAFAALLTQAYGPLAALTNAPVDVLTALVSFDRVFEVLDLDPAIIDAPDATTLAAPRGEVRFRDVRFAYPGPEATSVASLEDAGRAEAQGAGREVLHGVDLTVPPGATVALVGPSGAGKTTMLNLVPRLYEVTGGAVEVDGTDVRTLTLASLSAAIGVVTQDPHLFHDTVRANLVYAAPGADEERLVAACRAAQIHDVIAGLPNGYDTVVGERGHRLSGGEKQRLAVARVLLADPAIVLLDEATSHLDSTSEAAVQRALDAALAGRSCLVIAHRLSTIMGADEICVVDDGRIVERGTHAELESAGGLYAQLSRTQLRRPGAAQR